ncbi:hypothetical protein ETD86_47130 [Nonomuraea turkmeniaca]|uniref:Uncharacterized protein n=1 Tax=Nonomuraea turkmeniaca TaxID=103838 RepID=A0A5S4EYJ1_9ACTN|nr:hypothetical protein [Nonomuraea turkmeniaca]TMR08590.1 hypothetical protein ETD86_47130 [Nonomuraea turkmeniaca]
MGYDELIHEALITPLPPRTVVTEGYAANVPVARRRLEPLGVEVTETTGPFPAGSFGLIINRHEAYDPREIGRLLADGGTFVTQQVGAATSKRSTRPSALHPTRTATGPSPPPPPASRSRGAVRGPS